MKIFIWHEASHLTTSYHNGGGIVIVAPDLSAARQAWLDSPEFTKIKEYFADVEDHMSNLLTQEPNAYYDLAEATRPTSIHVFPDSGCC